MDILGAMPAPIQNAWNAVSEFGHSVKDRMEAIAASVFDAIVPEMFKPWCERNIKPLTVGDYLVLFIGLEISLFVLGLALHQYGSAALPLGICGAGLIMSGFGYAVYNNLQQHFNEKAWEQLDQMRRAAHDISNTNQDIASLLKERAVLDKPEYSHLEVKLKALDEETKKFRTDLTSPNYQDKLDIVNAHIDVISPLVQANAQDKDIVDELMEELDKIETDDQDLAAIETAKQNLKNLQTPHVLTQHAVELSQQINDLVKTLQGADFSKTKESYIEYLKGIQQSLSSKEVEDL